MAISAHGHMVRSLSVLMSDQDSMLLRFQLCKSLRESLGVSLSEREVTGERSLNVVKNCCSLFGALHL